VAPAELSSAAAGSQETGLDCGICQTAIAPGETVGRCPECKAPYHAECWTENSGCATYGCALMPETVAAEGPRAPQSYWGREEKDCPHCGKRLRVAALRCRHCGTVFESAAPVSTERFMTEELTKPKLQNAKRGAVIVFVTGLVPCSAPFALLIGSIWYFNNRPTIARLSSTRRVLAVLGLLAALASTLLLLVAAWMHAVASSWRS
jgi:uncharacterized CHY-type Zn-finger protein